MKKDSHTDTQRRNEPHKLSHRKHSSLTHISRMTNTTQTKPRRATKRKPSENSAALDKLYFSRCSNGTTYVWARWRVFFVYLNWMCVCVCVDVYTTAYCAHSSFSRIEWRQSEGGIFRTLNAHNQYIVCSVHILSTVYVNGDLQSTLHCTPLCVTSNHSQLSMQFINISSKEDVLLHYCEHAISVSFWQWRQVSNVYARQYYSNGFEFSRWIFVDVRLRRLMLLIHI